MSDREEEGEDEPRLSAAALAALQEFYAENEAGRSALRDSCTVGAVREDWVSGGVTTEHCTTTSSRYVVFCVQSVFLQKKNNK